MKFLESKKNLRKVFLIIAGLNLLFLVGVCILIFRLYQWKYPQIYVGHAAFTYLVLLIVMLLPFLQGLFGLWFASKKGFQIRNRRFVIVNVVILIPAVILSLLAGAIIIVVPPVRSYTENLNNYLVVDSNLNADEEIIHTFFPAEITDKTNSSYHYSQKKDLLGVNVEISVKVKLAENDYNIKKQEMESRGQFIQAGENKYQVTLYGTRYPQGVETFLQMTDEQHTVEYILVQE